MSAYDYDAIPQSETEKHIAQEVTKINITDSSKQTFSHGSQRYYIPPSAGAPRSTYRSGSSPYSISSVAYRTQRGRFALNRWVVEIRSRFSKLPFGSLLCRHPSSIIVLIAFVICCIVLVSFVSREHVESLTSKRRKLVDNVVGKIDKNVMPTAVLFPPEEVVRQSKQDAGAAKPKWKHLPDRHRGDVISKNRKLPSPRNDTQLVLVAPPTSTSVPPDTPSETATKRRFIKQMMKHAWDGYVQYAFGWNEVSPRTKKPHSAGIFGSNTTLGATIIDALDTLWIMGLREEFEVGRRWAIQRLNFSLMDADVSIFETNIRFVGGLLSAFSLSGDEALLRKAYELGRILLSAFDTPTGIPWAIYNFKKNKGKSWSWASGGSAILAEFGTLHLEFAYLSNVTGDPVFLEKVVHIRDIVDKLDKPKGLYPNYINLRTGHWGQLHTSVGGLGDSFYEYLFKVWLWSNQTDSTAKRMYDTAMQAIERELVYTSAGKHVYFVQSRKGRPVHQMDHLACFIGGLYGLSAPYAANASHYMLRGAQVADTCHFTYAIAKTGLGPESFHFQGGQEGRAIRAQEKVYYLRPETIETYFVMWRMTHNPVYRRWGWEAAQAIEKYCRAEAGYAGIRDVYADHPDQDDVQQSFFLAETLKYLYLLFVDENDDKDGSTAADDGGVNISLDDYVFNTEAHPIPIFGRKRYPNVQNLHIRPASTAAADVASTNATLSNNPMVS